MHAHVKLNMLIISVLSNSINMVDIQWASAEGSAAVMQSVEHLVALAPPPTSSRSNLDWDNSSLYVCVSSTKACKNTSSFWCVCRLTLQFVKLRNNFSVSKQSVFCIRSANRLLVTTRKSCRHSGWCAHQCDQSHLSPSQHSLGSDQDSLILYMWPISAEHVANYTHFLHHKCSLWQN